MFWGAKEFKIFFKKHCSIRTKKLHKMKLIFFYFDIWKKNYNS